MDIKESFHNNLNQIREGAEHSYGEHGKLVASAINHFGTKDHPAADESNLHLFSNKYVKSVLKKAHKHVTPEYQETLTNLMGSLKEDYDPVAKKGAEHADYVAKNLLKGEKKLKNKVTTLSDKFKKKAVTGMDEAKSAPDRVVTASKKAEKGTKWRLQARNMDSDGSEMELRQGKRVKMRGAFDRHAQDFNMSPTKKGKIDWKAKSKYYDDPKDILKTVKEEQIDEVLDTPKKRLGYYAKAIGSGIKASVTGNKKTEKKRKSGLEMAKRKTEKDTEKRSMDAYREKVAGKILKNMDKKANGISEEQIDEISSKLASSYLRGNHKSVTDPKGIELRKAYKRRDGKELAISKLSGTAKVPTKG